MGLIACTRVKGIWKRILLLVPALAVMILSEVIVPRPEASSPSMGLYLSGGFVFGIVLMVSGFKPRSGKRVSKP